MNKVFSYEEAFSRNIGWLTEAEQQVLRHKKVAIAGMGGVGGLHLLTLARLGVSSFHISDLDTFELANFNRQVGATMSTLDQSKIRTLRSMAEDVNPEISVTEFDEGINKDNLDAFLKGVDLYVDGLDFFVMEMRRRVFGRCHELGIPAITAAPIGMGTGYLIFMPGKMSFEDYFCLEGLPIEKQYVNFLLGLVPKGFHRTYLMDPTRLDLQNKRGPSTTIGCLLCASVSGTESLKILLNRKPVYSAPYYHHFDAYRGKWKRGYLAWGNRNPIQFIKRQLGYKALHQV